MKSRNLILLTVTVFALLTGNALAQNVRKVEIVSPPGITNNASTFELAVVHSTGLVYNAGNAFGNDIGVLDPNTNLLVANIAPAPANGFNGGSINFSRVNQTTNLIYFLQSFPNGIVVIDGRPSSPTFNQTLPGISFANQTIQSFAIDETRQRLYVATRETGSNPAQSQIQVVDIDPRSRSFHQTAATVALPAGQQIIHLAVNKATNKIYAGTLQSGGGVFVVNGATQAVSFIAGTQPTSVIAVNETSNTIYAGRTSAFVQAIDGVSDTLTANLALPSVPFSSGDTIAVNSVTERVYLTLTSGALSVIDAKRSSPTFNTVLTNITNIAAREVSLDEGTNKIVVATFTPRTVVIDGASNTIAATTTGIINSSDVAINPNTGRAFVAYQLHNVQKINLADNSFMNVPIAAEIGEGVVNPNNNSFYFARNVAESDAAYLDASDNLGAVSGLPHKLGRYLFTAQNTLTNRIYVVNSATNLMASATVAPGFVSVIDGATNSVIANIEVGAQPFGNPTVNEATNKIYVPHFGFGTAFPARISVINGATNVASTVNTAAFPSNATFAGIIRANPTANKIYFQVSNGASVGVINGATDVATPLPGVTNVFDIQINRNLNRVYFLTSTGLRVFDSASDMEIAAIPLVSPSAMAVNQTTGRIYVRGAQSLTAIDGNTNSIAASVSLNSVGIFSAIAVNETTNELYVGVSTDPNDESASGVLFVNGQTLAVRKNLPIPLRPGAIAVNPATKTLYVTTVNAPQRTGIVIISDSTQPTAGGQNVTVMPAEGVSVTFSNVTAAGNTSASALGPNDLSALPFGYAQLNNPFIYDITTTAHYSGNIVVTFVVPNVSSATLCSRMRLLHYINGNWDLSGNVTPVYNAGNQTCTLSQTVTSLGPFVAARNILR